MPEVYQPMTNRHWTARGGALRLPRGPSCGLRSGEPPQGKRHEDMLRALPGILVAAAAALTLGALSTAASAQAAKTSRPTS